MKKKIVITGGLGYIGTELCKLYSGVSWNHKIIVIDNRFISERVNQIRNWNMEFIQGDILDKNLIKKHLIDAHVVHHLAGVTAVPRTKSEASIIQDEKIKEEMTKDFNSKINLSYKVDESLLAGVKIKIGSIMIDNSLKNKLAKMKNSMKEV